LADGKPIPANYTAEQINQEAATLYHDSYDSCIAYLDRQVGLLLDELEQSGRLDNTLVIVTSDHGEHFGEHHFLGHGASLYRREVHVPLLLIPPSRSTIARVVNDPVSIREIPATVAQWVDLGPQSPFGDTSLVRFLDGRPVRPAEASPVLCEVQHIKTVPPTAWLPSTVGPMASLVTPDQVYIRHRGGREELYDFNDHQQLVDLATQPQSAPAIDEFRRTLSRIYGRVTSPPRVSRADR
jgi:arylsulfatase A-like enzyme